MINRIKGHFEEKDGKRCLFISPDKIQKNHKVFGRLKEIIKNINDYGQPIKYDDKYTKIKFNTDDNIPLNKINNIPPYFSYNYQKCHKKDDKYYLQVLLDDCLYQI